MVTEPLKEHKWLIQLLGNWTSQSVATVNSEGVTSQVTAHDKARPLGDYWVLIESQSESSEGNCDTSLMTLGYDPAKKRFIGTFISSAMANLWVYDGVLDAENNRLIFESEGPSLADDGSTALYKDVFEIKSPDHWVLTSHIREEDGTWTQFMTANYQRD